MCCTVHGREVLELTEMPSMGKWMNKGYAQWNIIQAQKWYSTICTKQMEVKDVVLNEKPDTEGQTLHALTHRQER